MTDCTHTRTEVRKQRFANGRDHLRAQCQACGELVGPYQPQEGIDLDAVPAVDYDFMAVCRRREQDQRSRRIEEDRRQKHLAYEAYLRRSDRWRRIREAVMDRDDGICRGCLAAPATEVHHRNYENIFQEFCWDLVAVCRPCHERAHGQPQRIGDVAPAVMANIQPQKEVV